MHKLNYLLISILITLIGSSAHAYIGPGMSGGIIVATLGIVFAIFAVLLGILYYPIKRFLKNRKQKSINNKQK